MYSYIYIYFLEFSNIATFHRDMKRAGETCSFHVHAALLFKNIILSMLN